MGTSATSAARSWSPIRADTPPVSWLCALDAGSQEVGWVLGTVWIHTFPHCDSDKISFLFVYKLCPLMQTSLRTQNCHLMVQRRGFTRGLDPSTLWSLFLTRSPIRTMSPQLTHQKWLRQACWVLQQRHLPWSVYFSFNTREKPNALTPKQFWILTYFPQARRCIAYETNNSQAQLKELDRVAAQNIMACGVLQKSVQDKLSENEALQKEELNVIVTCDNFARHAHFPTIGVKSKRWLTHSSISMDIHPSYHPIDMAANHRNEAVKAQNDWNLLVMIDHHRHIFYVFLLSIKEHYLFSSSQGLCVW
jgi:hypothetical protein